MPREDRAGDRIDGGLGLRYSARMTSHQLLVASVSQEASTERGGRATVDLHDPESGDTRTLVIPVTVDQAWGILAGVRRALVDALNQYFGEDSGWRACLKSDVSGGVLVLVPV